MWYEIEKVEDCRYKLIVDGDVVRRDDEEEMFVFKSEAIARYKRMASAERGGFPPGWKFINVYMIDRCYGGPQEGGWWYDCGEFLRTRPVPPRGDAEKVRDRYQRWLDFALNEHRRSDISSVLSEGRYVAFIEDVPGADFPRRQPSYE